MEDRYRTFLLRLGTADKTHTGRTFFEHLKGVHDLLRDWGNDEHVCLAGLFHSIYGNEIWKHRMISSRDPLIAVIGERAELLVHYFNTKKRPLFEDVDNEELREELCEIEAANIIEQHGGGKTLKALSHAKLSIGARAAIIMELAVR